MCRKTRGSLVVGRTVTVRRSDRPRAAMPHFTARNRGIDGATRNRQIESVEFGWLRDEAIATEHGGATDRADLVGW